MVGEWKHNSKPIYLPTAYGNLPQGWSWSRLDDICDGVYDCPHSTPALTSFGPYVVRTQDIITGIFRVDQAGHVSEGTYIERISRVTPAPGDLLYSREGTYFGIAAEVPSNVRVCLGQRMVLMRPHSQRLNSRYLRYWLNSPVMAAHIHGFRDGSVAERLNLPTIRALAVLVPPLPVQMRIAHILGMLDDQIELNQRMSKTLEEMARALFKSWLIDFDPVRAKAKGRKPEGMDAATAKLFPSSFEDSALGRIPKGWRVGKLSDVAIITMGQSPQGETFNEDGNGIVFYQGRAEFGWRYPTRRLFTTDPKRMAQANDVLMSVRAPVGDINVANEACCIGRGLSSIRSKNGQSSFMLYAMVSLKEQLDVYDGEGTVFGCINKDALGGLKILIPPESVMIAFEMKARYLDSMIFTKSMQSRNLGTLRDTLLPRLLSGGCFTSVGNL